MIKFDTISDVEAWARQHGGLEAVNEVLAHGALGQDAQSIRTAIRYVEREELKIAERASREGRGRAASAIEQLALDAQRSARNARISQWVAIAAALLAIVAAMFPMIR